MDELLQIVLILLLVFLILIFIQITRRNQLLEVQQTQQTPAPAATQYVIPWEVPFYFNRPYQYFYPYRGPGYYRHHHHRRHHW